MTEQKVLICYCFLYTDTNTAMFSNWHHLTVIPLFLEFLSSLSGSYLSPPSPNKK